MTPEGIRDAADAFVGDDAPADDAARLAAGAEAELIRRIRAVRPKQCVTCGEHRAPWEYAIKDDTRDRRATTCVYCVNEPRRVNRPSG